MLALHARISDELGVTLPEMDLGGGFGIAYTTQDDPSDPAQLATEMTKIVEHECRALGIPEPRLSIEPGRAIVGPAMCTVYRSAPSSRSSSTAAPSAPTSRSTAG